ncbi:hypothetical protein LSCM1_05387 [Leishmania martiniquensis]|uniref:Sm domain-containing protein n=1 Tax=Leishmania martiniquensis TaxID=1580590 RepID=A0A836H075_9TRYP|nr:hypothetical protein LSCM1_05387 [Leishmania martiniquensis]
MLSQYLRKRVSVVTADGRNLVGVLHAADQLLNIVLTSCVERVGAPYDFEDGETGEGNGAVVDESVSAAGSSGSVTRGALPALEEVHLGVMMLRGADIVSIAAVDVYEEAGTNVKDWRGRDMPPAITAAKP